VGQLTALPKLPIAEKKKGWEGRGEQEKGGQGAGKRRGRKERRKVG